MMGLSGKLMLVTVGSRHIREEIEMQVDFQK